MSFYNANSLTGMTVNNLISINCGTNTPGTGGVLLSSGNTMAVRFHSDHRFANDFFGFSANVAFIGSS